MELKYNNKNRINPSAFNKLETYIFQFENALSIEKIIELNEVVFKGCKHFEAIYLSQKEKLKKSKLTNIEISENPYLNEVFELYNSYKKLLNDIENHQKTNEATKPETSTPDEVKNPYPDIFKNADYYKKFLEYSKKHIIDAHKDYSYLKKRMQKDKFIFRISDNEFYDFLINKIKVKEKRLIEIYTKEKKFYSQKKSNSEHRLNNYNIVFEIE